MSAEHSRTTVLANYTASDQFDSTSTQLAVTLVEDHGKRFYRFDSTTGPTLYVHEGDLNAALIEASASWELAA